MSRALAAVKRLVGVDVDHVVDAKERHAAAQAELERVAAAQSTSVQAARDAFDREGTEAAADEVVRIEARAKLMNGAATAKVASAAQVLTRAEAEAKAARLVELDSLVRGLRPRIAALAPKAAPHVEALLALLDERESLVREAEMAHTEADTLRGLDNRSRDVDAIGVDIRAARVVLRGRLLETFGPARVGRLEDFFR
jgi:hypothetical protein